MAGKPYWPFFFFLQAVEERTSLKATSVGSRQNPSPFLREPPLHHGLHVLLHSPCATLRRLLTSDDFALPAKNLDWAESHSISVYGPPRKL